MRTTFFKIFFLFVTDPYNTSAIIFYTTSYQYMYFISKYGYYFIITPTTINVLYVIMVQNLKVQLNRNIKVGK